MIRAHIPKIKINGKTATYVINLLNFNNHYIFVKDLSELFAFQKLKMGIKFASVQFVEATLMNKKNLKNIIKKKTTKILT